MAQREPSDAIECLSRQAERSPDHVAFRFRSGSNRELQTITYLELHERACGLAALLSERSPNEARVLLLYPPGIEFIVAFYACLYAARVAIPMSPPHPAQVSRVLPRLRALLRDAKPHLVLGTGKAFERVHALYAELDSDWGLAFLDAESLGELDHTLWRRPPVGAHDVAFLQYTSGSTAVPKGVVLSHANLISNLIAIRRTLASPLSVVRGVFWLPLYHDMGLIGGVLGNVYTGGDTLLMSPLDFVKRPIDWLQSITEHQANISGAPDFGYRLAVERTTEAERATLDLSSWDVAFSGAERIRVETLRRFAETFAPYGFRRSSFWGSYGLAEATLLVSCGRIALDATIPSNGGAPGASELVGSGHVAPTTTVAIVDPATRRVCQPGEPGEIWIAGPGIARGYWQRGPESAATFGLELAGTDARFLRSGDLGFLAGQELVVTGRLKDMLIVNGSNHYPEDIEATVGRSHPLLRAEGCAAFSIDRDEERLVLFLELARPNAATAEAGVDLEAIRVAVRTSLSEQHRLAAHDIVFLRAGSLPKTSSGKLQRYVCRQRYESGAVATDRHTADAGA